MSSQSKPTRAIDTSLPPPKTTTPAVKAAQLFNKLLKLDADEAVEIADAPQSIRARYQDRRAKLLDGADADVRALVARMRGEP